MIKLLDLEASGDEMQDYVDYDGDAEVWKAINTNPYPLDQEPNSLFSISSDNQTNRGERGAL